MKRGMVLAVVLVVMAAVGAPSVALAGRVPLIATGWDSPDTRGFRDGLAQFEAWGVLDGTTLRANRVLADGKSASAINAFCSDVWQWSEFASALADLRAAHPTTCRENYLMLYSNPGNVDWFDDAGWKQVVDHWRLLGRLARQGGLRGLLFDAEPYQPPHSQYLYTAQPGAAKHTFAEYQAMARKRGREVMTALRAEFPNATIFAYRLVSDMLGLLDCGDPGRAMMGDVFGLFPAFMDGWLDVMPRSMTVIEGAEDIGYRANSQAAYDSAYTRLKLRMPEFVAPEHQEQVRRQFRVGQSLYLDAYVTPPGAPWHIDSTGSTPGARLAANVASALAASDGLVWLYGERGRWWPNAKAPRDTWPDRLQGAIAAIGRARDPIGYARTVVARGAASANLLANPGMLRTGDGDGAPDSWLPWQHETSHGRILGASGQVELRGTLNGVVSQNIPVQPGKPYAVRIRVRTEGKGLAFLGIGWKTAAGVWTAHSSGRRFLPAGPAAADGWREIVGLVEVPADAGRIMFMATHLGAATEADRCWFDDAVLMPAGE